MTLDALTMNNKTVLVTGATDGIGRQTALGLARLGAQVILHGRNAARLDAARDDILLALPGARLGTVLADFSSLEQVRAMAQTIQRDYPRLDVLVNNAATYMKERELSTDGFEMTFAVNTLAPFLLTNLLAGLLVSSAPSRVITVSSVAHGTARLEFDNLQGEKEFKAWRAYSVSKLCNILITRELAERLAGCGVTANSLHPGVVNTKLLRASFDMPGSSVEVGARTSIYLASSADVEKVSGKYFTDMQVSRPSPLVDDAALRKQLWQVCAALVGLDTEQV